MLTMLIPRLARATRMLMEAATMRSVAGNFTFSSIRIPPGAVESAPFGAGYTRELSDSEKGLFKSEKGLFNIEKGLFKSEKGIFNIEKGLFNTEKVLFNTEKGLFNIEKGLFDSEKGP